MTNIKRLRIIATSPTSTTTTATTTTTTTDDMYDSGLSIPCDMTGKKPSMPKLVFQLQKLHQTR